MENAKKVETPHGFDMDHASVDSPELERELRLMAELLLDIYIDKKSQRMRKNSGSPDFDLPKPRR
ncbi:MAG: hypothetical protein ACRD4P_03825 [Bryobacteraceae bacterium]